MTIVPQMYHSVCYVQSTSKSLFCRFLGCGQKGSCQALFIYSTDKGDRRRLCTTHGKPECGSARLIPHHLRDTSSRPRVCKKERQKQTQALWSRLVPGMEFCSNEHFSCHSSRLYSVCIFSKERDLLVTLSSHFCHLSLLMGRGSRKIELLPILIFYQLWGLSMSVPPC